MHNLYQDQFFTVGARGLWGFVKTISKCAWWFIVCFCTAVFLGKTRTWIHKAFQSSASSLWDALTVQVRLKKKKRKKKTVMFACLSAKFWLTMWMKSTGVAVYKSQCSLSRMILSMRRISAVEKLHPLCATRSLTEPITCLNRHRQREANKLIVLK